MKGDTLQRFLFEHAPVRGLMVQLDAAYRGTRDAHEYPPAVGSLLGQGLAAATLLSGSVKHTETLILQARGTGPVHLLVAQCSSQRSLRGLARWHGEVREGGLPTLCGEGHLVITIDPGEGRERYQGLVPLAGETLGGALETYFAQSEQLPTRLWLACDASRAAGLLLQELPGSQRDPETWSRVQILAATVTDRELLELSLETLCGRLFPEDDIRVFTPERVTARCTCGRETVTAVLRSLGRRELEAALRETGTLELTCEFCNRRYVFDPVDVELILAGSSGVEGPGRRQ